MKICVSALSEYVLNHYKQFSYKLTSVFFVYDMYDNSMSMGISVLQKSSYFAEQFYESRFLSAMLLIAAQCMRLNHVIRVQQDPSLARLESAGFINFICNHE